MLKPPVTVDLCKSHSAQQANEEHIREPGGLNCGAERAVEGGKKRHDQQQDIASDHPSHPVWYKAAIGKETKEEPQRRFSAKAHQSDDKSPERRNFYQDRWWLSGNVCAIDDQKSRDQKRHPIVGTAPEDP